LQMKKSKVYSIYCGYFFLLAKPYKYEHPGSRILLMYRISIDFF
jgi:hypothetical protein